MSRSSRRSPTSWTSLKARVSPWPTWSTTAPWNFSLEPRLFLNWKYCTELEPWPTADMLAASCIPGRFSRETGCQLVALGQDSISRNGFCFMERITSCQRAWFWASSTSPLALPTQTG